VSRGHARSLATQFLLQIRRFDKPAMRRDTSRVSSLMCPFCVREVLTDWTTYVRCRSSPVSGTARKDGFSGQRIGQLDERGLGPTFRARVAPTPTRALSPGGFATAIFTRADAASKASDEAADLVVRSGQSTRSTALPPMRRSTRASSARAGSRNEASSSIWPSNLPSAMSVQRRVRSLAALAEAASSSKRFSV
jgi:hypothetical protein